MRLSRMNEGEVFSFKPLTPEVWGDFTRLFGERGASAGCWCMWWRTADRKEFDRSRGEANRRAMKELVVSGCVPGILLYRGDTPVAWCAVAPRGQFPRLERTRNLKKIDDLPVWSVPCLFVARAFRKQGVTAYLLACAVEYVKGNGGCIVEGYPSDPAGETIAAFVEAGFKSTYERAGFYEAAKRGSRPIMRYEIACGMGG